MISHFAYQVGTHCPNLLPQIRQARPPLQPPHDTTTSSYEVPEAPPPSSRGKEWQVLKIPQMQKAAISQN